MTAVTELWLPILVSAVAVFMVSAVIHMATPMHKGDYGKLPDEDKTLDALRAAGVAPGHYMFPQATCSKDMQTPEMKAKLDRGPVGHMTVLQPGGWNMGRSLLNWFILTIVIGLGAGYIAGIGLPHGAASVTVFRLTATVALLAHGTAGVTDAIWKGVSWGIATKFIVDGLLYALATGAVFAWLWPAAAV